MPAAFRSLALVSPTGFDARASRREARAGGPGMPLLRDALSFPLWSRSLYDLLVSRASIRYFLGRTWGSPAIDEGLLEYDYLTTHQPGAQHAPYSFVSGLLFSADIVQIYDALTVPVWLTQGVRGDFVDYSRASGFAGRPGWIVETFPTSSSAATTASSRLRRPLPQHSIQQPAVARTAAASVSALASGSSK
jgi:hypothetical protein